MNITKLLAVFLLTAFFATGPAWAGPGQTPTGGAEAGQEKFSSNKAEFAGELRGAVENYLASQMPDNITDWKLTSMGGIENEPPPKNYEGYRISSGSSSLNGDQRTIVVEFLKNDKIIKRLSLNCRVEMYVQAVLAKGNVPRGATITPDMVEVRRTLVDSPPSDLNNQVEDVIGRVAERNIQSGKLVRKSHIARAMDVKAGDLVVIVAKSDAVQLTARGIAKKEGVIGEMIPVVNLRSNKKLFAKILEGGTVAVEF